MAEGASGRVFFRDVQQESASCLHDSEIDGSQDADEETCVVRAPRQVKSSFFPFFFSSDVSRFEGLQITVSVP